MARIPETRAEIADRLTREFPELYEGPPPLPPIPDPRSPHTILTREEWEFSKTHHPPVANPIFNIIHQEVETPMDHEIPYTPNPSPRQLAASAVPAEHSSIEQNSIFFSRWAAEWQAEEDKMIEEAKHVSIEHNLPEDMKDRTAEDAIEEICGQLYTQKEYIDQHGSAQCPDVVSSFFKNLEALAFLTNGEHPVLLELLR